MTLKHPFAAAVFSVATLLACAGISAPASAAVAPGDPLTSFVFTTVVDATSVGGDPVAPLRITFQFSPGLAPRSGPFGSSTDGTFESYGPVEKMILEVGRQCLATGGDGTGITVFNSADEDSFDVRADIPAVVGKKLFGLNLRFFRFLLVDPAATMFDSTALPASPQFAGASDFQQTTIDLVDANGVRTRLDPGDVPYALRNFSPQEDIAALMDLVNQSQAKAAIKAKLNAPLQQASTLLGGVLVQKNVVKARGALEDFIKLVQTNRNKIGVSEAASLTTAARGIIDSLPACA